MTKLRCVAVELDCSHSTLPCTQAGHVYVPTVHFLHLVARNILIVILVFTSLICVRGFYYSERYHYVAVATTVHVFHALATFIFCDVIL